MFFLLPWSELTGALGPCHQPRSTPSSPHLSSESGLPWPCKAPMLLAALVVAKEGRNATMQRRHATIAIGEHTLVGHWPRFLRR
jgi:hypothetical protein